MADDGSPSDSHNSPDGNGKEDSDENNEPLRLDLGDEATRKLETNRLGNIAQGASGSNMHEGQRREENPFSFKHFLQSDSNAYQNKGARPKVYCEGRPVAVPMNAQEGKQGRVVPELASALPDFVQDHLVIEQCYLGNSSNNFVDINNLPDFAPTRDTQRTSHGGNRDGFDLPGRQQMGFPLDLPIGNQNQSLQRPTSNEVGNSKSLPDFLADSAVCSQKSDDHSNPLSPETEVEELRSELELVRRQLGEQTRRADQLQRDLLAARNKEHDYTHNLAKALEEVEENLEKSNRKAAASSLTINKLKQEIKILTNEITMLRHENESLKGQEAAGGHGNGRFNYIPNEFQSIRLANELRAAASTAEHSLRQLLTGVDNLRMMASSLENMHRIEEKNDAFLDKEDHDRTGPAL